MKVVRCKDCVLMDDAKCPLRHTKRPVSFFCADGRRSPDKPYTNADEFRDMSDAELAQRLYQIERNGIETATLSDTKIKKFWKGYLANPVDEDY